MGLGWSRSDYLRVDRASYFSVPCGTQYHSTSVLSTPVPLSQPSQSASFFFTGITHSRFSAFVPVIGPGFEVQILSIEFQFFHLSICHLDILFKLPGLLFSSSVNEQFS